MVAANRFITDTDEEIEIMRAQAEEHGAKFAPCEIFAKGGEGGIELAMFYHRLN